MILRLSIERKQMLPKTCYFIFVKYLNLHSVHCLNEYSVARWYWVILIVFKRVSDFCSSYTSVVQVNRHSRIYKYNITLFFFFMHSLRLLLLSLSHFFSSIRIRRVTWHLLRFFFFVWNLFFSFFFFCCSNSMNKKRRIISKVNKWTNSIKETLV